MSETDAPEVLVRRGAMPSVCVAIPVKNGSAYLAEAIESVLAQTGVDLSVRVIDNQSDDDSLELAQRYASTRD